MAIVIASNGLRRTGNRMASPACAAMARSSDSLMPPAAGTRPTPVSTRPMATSVWAWTRAQCRQTSRPPPSTRPNGAATMGTGEYLIAMLARCARRSVASMPSQSPALILSTIILRSAPPEKWAPWLPMTSASYSAPARSMASSMKASTGSLTTFALVWNSMQATRSPRSTRLACSVLGQRLSGRLEMREHDGPRPRRQRLVRGLPRPPDRGAPVGILVEERAVRGRQLRDPLRNRAAVGPHPRHRLGHAERVPELEGTEVPRVAPAHGVVDRGDVVADLGDAVGAVEQGAGDDLPGEAAGRVVGRDGRLDARDRVGDLRRGRRGSAAPASGTTDTPGWLGRWSEHAGP